MVSADKLIAAFERMYREHWTYEWGAARTTCVDCSGAFVYAYWQLGAGDIAHGSNTIFRTSIGTPSKTPKPGYAAFKVRAWKDSESNNKWYGKAPGDVYHIGLVNADASGVLNAKSTKAGFCLDSVSGWDYFAPLKAITYEETAPEALEGGCDAMYKAMVQTQADPLRVREWAKTGTILGHVPKGREVEVLSEEKDGWVRIRFNELVGYVACQYLAKIEESETAEDCESQDEIEKLKPQNVDVMSATDEGYTTIVRDNGQRIVLWGRWEVAREI